MSSPNLTTTQWTWDAWVHPAVGGDDYNTGGVVEASSRSAAQKMIRILLKKKGCCKANDFTVYEK